MVWWCNGLARFIKIHQLLISFAFEWSDVMTVWWCGCELSPVMSEWATKLLRLPFWGLKGYHAPVI